MVFVVVDLFINEAEVHEMALFNYFNRITKVPSTEKMETKIESLSCSLPEVFVDMVPSDNMQNLSQVTLLKFR